MKHPDLVMIGMGSIIIGIPPEGKEQRFFERTETISLSHVVKLLPLSGIKAS